MKVVMKKRSTVSAVFEFILNKLFLFIINFIIFLCIYCFKYLFFCLVTVIVSYIGNKTLCPENLNFKVMRCFRISIINHNGLCVYVILVFCT